ncbi:NADH-quinone oxidoreductase subunit NuoE [Hirschia maritima]|uniref:NADH-quinone oxidoreductase subunit NuoE n=1 Tax=Hirschia maritima TaxID=1121961 RepID=UPI00036DD9A4|nr:NADH-quinone oxidoreductase subunit NuoE [Hirschia maritima]
MSNIRRFDMDAGGSSFSFKQETEAKIAFWLSKYPNERKRSAVIPMLWLAQKDNGGWLSEPAMREVADRLEMAYIRVYEVATFYTMFRMQPVGEFHVQVCGTTPCMLRGSDDLIKVCKSKIGDKGSVGANGKLSWEEVECLGACVNAPMAQINDYYFEDLDETSMAKLLDDFVAGKDPQPGTRIDRQTSAPEGGMTTLLDESLYDGSLARQLTSIPGAPSSVVESAEPDVAVKETASSPKLENNASADKTETEVPKKTENAGKPTLEDTDRPLFLDKPEGEADDLKQVSGIGPKIEATLNELGVFHFSQIADWSKANIEWVNGYLSFKGRVERENWIPQARLLSVGGETEFSRRQSKVSEKGE